ncbi:MAG: HAMP domain-containing histidine kinase [Planctomycetaceae bacterium]|nr:HAMP domain-containing histidine kinase [Planctomycetaceae bacterium]
MLVTRTIRRKMEFWLAVLAVVLGGLAASSITGLTSYKQTKKDLELSIQSAPRSADLATAISLLIRPCAIDVPMEPGPARDSAARLQMREFEQAFQTARNRVDDFRSRLDSLSITHRNAALSETHRALFARIDDTFAHLEAAGQCLTRSDRDRQERFILQNAAALLGTIDSIPDPAMELSDRLALAEREYRWRLAVVWTTSVIAAALFLGLAVCGYRWVFAPLSALHQGALRVADGEDFDFRIESRTNDELSELADAFNRMTARFQQVKADLDQQVHQRSRQLVQSERLAGVGFLAAGVAHEINNPLSAIVGAADSLDWRLGEHLDKFPPDDAQTVREYLHMMQTEAQRCRQITERLLNFARGTDTERNLYDVTAIVQEVVGMTHHLGRFRNRQVLVDRTDPCYAWVNGPEIKQVVLNLVANALESTGESGRVSVAIRECPEHVEIGVTDDGVGMTQEVLEHIFEPFFTRREAGKGTGLGLSISHRIVQDHGGSLEASSPGKGLGSTFRLRVPRQAGKQRAA